MLAIEPVVGNMNTILLLWNLFLGAETEKKEKNPTKMYQ
jgi:hypothetical protein